MAQTKLEEKYNINESDDVSDKKNRPFGYVILSSIFPMIVSLAAAITLSGFFFNGGSFFKISNKISEVEKLNRYLSDGVKNGLFSEEYFNIAFNHYDRKSDGKLNKYGRIETLEDFIIYMNSADTDQKNVNLQDVTNLLVKTKETEPFSALPAEERRLMDQLQVLISLQSSPEQVANTLNELKQVILARHKEYQRIESQNAWSLPLSFVGVLLTLVFGVWTTVLSIKDSREKYNTTYRDVVIKNSN